MYITQFLRTQFTNSLSWKAIQEDSTISSSTFHFSALGNYSRKESYCIISMSNLPICPSILYDAQTGLTGSISHLEFLWEKMFVCNEGLVGKIETPVPLETSYILEHIFLECEFRIKHRYFTFRGYIIQKIIPKVSTKVIFYLAYISDQLIDHNEYHILTSYIKLFVRLH